MKHFASAATILLIALGSIASIWAISTGEFFRSPVRLIGHIILPGILALTGFAFLFVSARARAMFVACALSAVGALVSFEVYLQLRGAPTAQVLGGAGEAGASAVAQNYRQEGRAFPHICDAMVPVRVEGTQVVSPISIDGVPIQILTGLAENRLALPANAARVDRRTDLLGFNNPPEQWRPGAVRALVVGDSFTFGFGAPLGEGFVDHFRSSIGTTVNLGCGGNGPLSELATLVEYGRILRPKLVVWAFYEGNDLRNDLGREAATALLPRYLDSTFKQDLYKRREAIDRAVEIYLQSHRAQTPAPAAKSAASPWQIVNDVVRLEYLRMSLGLMYGYKQADFELFTRIMGRARDEVRNWGGALVFAYIPARGRYESIVARWDTDSYKQGVLSMVESLGIHIVDFDAEFRRVVDDPRTLFAGHFTPEGHALAGKFLAMKVRSHLTAD